MKKIYLLSLALLSAFSIVTAQTSTIELTNEATGLPVANGGIIYRGTNVGVEDILLINIKNISGSTVAYKFRRFDDVLNSGADAYFCVQACYPPATMVSPTSLTLAPNQDAISTGVDPSFHLLDNSTAGQSDIRYHIYDAANPTTDLFVVTVKYNNALSVKNTTSLFSNISDVYPNPSTSKAFINVSSAIAINGVKVSITNTLGAIVSYKLVDLSAGKNTVSLDFENLLSGIYFVTIGQGTSRITKKITISK